MPDSPVRRGPSWLARTQLSGAIASVASSVVVAACSVREAHAGFAGVNAASQWIWGERAKRHVRPSWRYSAVGYLVHHFSSLLWAGLHEYWHLQRPVSQPRQALAHAAVIATGACLVDYTVTPRRFRPGFERHLSRSSIALVYAGFAAGLVGSTWLIERSRRRARTAAGNAFERAHAGPAET